MINKKTIIDEMINKQLKNIKNDKKLLYTDIKRIVKNIKFSIFGDECSIWNGYIVNLHDNRSSYINFYFKNKKLALHRLLYCNYTGSIDNNERIYFSCNNKGKCCTIKHLIKNETEVELKEVELKEFKDKYYKYMDIENFTISFD